MPQDQVCQLTDNVFNGFHRIASHLQRFAEKVNIMIPMRLDEEDDWDDDDFDEEEWDENEGEEDDEF